MNKKLDHEKAMALYLEGKTDREIADTCDVNYYTVVNFRKKYKLKCHKAYSRTYTPKKKEIKKPSRLVEEVREARQCGMSYGMWKVKQFEEQRIKT